MNTVELTRTILVPPHRLWASVVDDDDESPDPTTGEENLEDAARGERDYVRERLQAELGREPTEAEIDEWVQQQTEGY